MNYSVENLSKLANVSVRTLHYYDEIGLLRPAMSMENGRRYYQIEQLLILLDVLFFKKIGFSLEKIKSMLTASNVDKTSLLAAKKLYLKKEIKRMQELIKIIDQTEFYFEGDKKDQAEILKQFELLQKNTNEYKKSFEKEFGKFIDKERAEKIKKMSIEEQKELIEKKLNSKKFDKKLYKKRANACMKKIIEAINNNVKEDSQEVQALMKEYFEISSMIQPLSKKDWMRIAISTGDDFDAFTIWSKMHPKMPKFLFKAMKIYAGNLQE